jgi:long-subunit fatty acid transport protein
MRGRNVLGFGPARKLAAAAALSSLLVAGAAQADGGYYAGVKGARAAGRGGAFTVRADDVSAAGINPAGLTNIGTTMIQVGNRFSYNQHTYTRNPTLDWLDTTSPPYVEFDKVSNKAPWQALDPLIGVASNFGLKDWAFALAAYSPSGVARKSYPGDGGQNYMMVRRNAQLLDYGLSAAWKFHELFGLGLTVQWIAVPTLDYSLVVNGSPLSMDNGNPVSGPNDMRTNVHGHDYFTLNAILGGWLRVAPFLEFGASGQILPSEIHTQSTLDVTPANSNDPVKLTRNGKPANDVNLTLPLPMSARLGARYIYKKQGREVFDVELDGVFETWSRVNSFHLSANNLVAEQSNQSVAFGDIDVQKHWQNTFGVHLGGDARVVPDVFTARGGVYYETATAKPAYANIDFADGRQLGFALGGSAYIGKLEVAFAYEYRVMPTVRVSDADARVYQNSPGTPCVAPYTNTSECSAAYLGHPGPPVNGGEYFAYSHVMSLDLLYRF